MDLVATPDNPIPEGTHVLRVVASDGTVLRAAHWDAPAGSARGTVLIMQGRAESIEKYFETIGELRARGFAVAAFDWRGQGGSQRELDDARKGHVRRFRHYRHDFAATYVQVLERHCSPPYFALAHSMGAAIALDMARDEALPVSRLVATAPMMGLAMIRWPAAARHAARALWLFGRSSAYVPGGGATSVATKPFAGNPLTSDPIRYARNADIVAALGNRATGDPTIGWLNGAFGLMRRLGEPRAALEIRVPTLIFAAGADEVCLTSAIEHFGARLKAGGVVVLPGARHEILMERDAIREEFWAAFDAFVPGTQAPAAAPSAPGEEIEGGGVDAAVAGGDDRAPL